MDDIIRSRKMGGLTPDDRRRAETALAAVKALRVIIVAATVFMSVAVLVVFVWKLSAQLAWPLLAFAGLVMLVTDVVVVAVIWRALDRQHASLTADIAEGQVEEIICLLPDGLTGYNRLAAACALPVGQQPGAGQAAQLVSRARRKLASGQELRLRILSGCRYLLSAEPC